MTRPIKTMKRVKMAMRMPVHLRVAPSTLLDSVRAPTWFRDSIYRLIVKHSCLKCPTVDMNYWLIPIESKCFRVEVSSDRKCWRA